MNGIIIGLNTKFPQAPLFIGKGTLQNDGQVFFRKLFEEHHACSGKQRGNDFKRRVFRCGTDQGDKPAFHMREKGVLLGFVEPVYFINK